MNHSDESDLNLGIHELSMQKKKTSYASEYFVMALKPQTGLHSDLTTFTEKGSNSCFLTES